MFGRNGCWTVAQKMLDIERRLDALEKKTYLVYEHNLSFFFTRSGTDVGQAFIKVTNNNNVALTVSDVMTYIGGITNGKYIPASGYTETDKVVCAITNGETRPYVILNDTGTEEFDDIRVLNDYVVPVEVATV